MTMVSDHGVPFNETWSTTVDHCRMTMVVHGRPWLFMVDHGPFRLGMVLDGNPWYFVVFNCFFKRAGHNYCQSHIFWWTHGC